MKIVKKIMALLLVAVISLTVTGCLHKKDEIAVTIDGIEFTSAYYMCALINANMEAKNLVYEDLDEEKNSTEVDYYSKKVEGKKFVEWVEDKAIETLKEIAAYQLLCKENKIELDKEEIKTIETNASYMWAGYGYGAYFEPNGVNVNTYTEYSKSGLYSESYFKFLYAKDGKNAISDEDVKSKIYEKFEIANILDVSYEEKATEDSKKALKTKLEAYAKELQAGKKTFEQVYVEYNKEENHSHEDDAKDGPKDPHAQILGAEDTNYHTENYDTVKPMKIGEAKVIENSSKTGLILLFKQDIKADPYYLTNLDMDARHIIADKDFEKLVDDYAKKLKPEISDYAIGQFDVKDIQEPTVQ